MPYVKSISIHSTVQRSIAYILNPDKTEDLVYTTALNCMANAKDAYLAMKSVYEHFSGEKFNTPSPLNSKGSVKAIHYIQSFDPQDNITPELAHRIAKAFARKTFGDNCQVVIATHLDKGHLHNHYILNTYTLDGKKFNANKTTLNKIKEYSDRVCLAFGIQPYDKSKGKGKTLAYNEWEHKKRGTSWKQQIRLDIDMLIVSVKNIDELLCELEMMGYSIKRGKYISIKAQGQERYVRTKTLGEDYTEESLVSRILWRDVGSNISLTGEPAPIRSDYLKAIDEVSELARTGRKVQRKRDSSMPYTPENDMDVYKLSAQLTIINRDNIHSIGELEGKIETLKSEYENARQELNTLSAKQDSLSGLVEQAEKYFELLDKPSITLSEKLKLNICKQAISGHNIQTRSDLEQLKSTSQETAKKNALLKENFEKCRRLYEVYSDIAHTYYDISIGDYISRLVAEEQQKRESEAQQNKKNKSI